MELENGNQLSSQHELGEKPVGKLLFKMSAPMMISMFMLACYNVVDSIFISRVSEAALSALSLAYPIQFLMVAINIGTAVGMTALISRSLGERKPELANRYARHGLFLSIIYCVIFTLLGFFFVEKFFRFVTNDEAIIKEGVDYLSIILIFSSGFFLTTIFEKMMQATGKSIHSMITQLTGAITNIILDPIMIFGLFGFPAMGTKGAAIATVAGEIFGAIVGITLNKLFNKDIKIELFKFKLNTSFIANIYKIGIPSIVMQSIGSFMVAGLNAILIRFQSAVAVLGVYYRLQSFIFMPLFGLNSGMIPIISYNFGAKDKKRIVDTLRIAVIAGFCIMAIGTFLFMVFPRQIFSLFAASETMTNVGINAFRLIAPTFIFANFSILFGSVMQATKREIYSLIPSLTRQLVVLLPSAYIFANIWGVNGVWLSFPFAEIFSTILSIIFFIKTYKEQIATL